MYLPSYIFIFMVFQIDEMTKTYNLEVMKYFSFGLENAIVDGKRTDDEINNALEVAQNAINSAKLGIQSLSGSNSIHFLSKVYFIFFFFNCSFISKINLDDLKSFSLNWRIVLEMFSGTWQDFFIFILNTYVMLKLSKRINIADKRRTGVTKPKIIHKKTGIWKFSREK